jgi:hypothetical protein
MPSEAYSGESEMPVKTPFDAVKGFFKAMSPPPRSDVSTWVTSDFHLLEVGQVWDMGQLLAAIEGDYRRQNYFHLIRGVVHDDTAWVSYWNRAVIDRAGMTQELTWLESAVLERSAGRWLIQMLHSSRVAPADVPTDIEWTEHR